MPLYDADCPRCGEVELIASVENRDAACPQCGMPTRRLIGVPAVNCANQDAAWIRSVREVVDKDGDTHCQQFLKEPTRKNYQIWMKKEGIRPMDPGEEKIKPNVCNSEKIFQQYVKEQTDVLYSKHRQRKALNVSSGKQAV